MKKEFAQLKGTLKVMYYLEYTEDDFTVCRYRTVKDHSNVMNYFEDEEFKMKFRLHKEPVIDLFEMISDKFPNSSRGISITPILQLIQYYLFAFMQLGPFTMSQQICLV